MRGLFIIGAALLAAGSPALSNDEAAAAPAADANLFIYREHAEPLIWAPTVKIDGRKVIAIGQKQYTAIHLEAGTHSIQLAWPIFSGQKGRKGTITIADDKTLYLEVTGTSQYVGIGFLLGSGLRERDDGAVALSACCEFKAPKY